MLYVMMNSSFVLSDREGTMHVRSRGQFMLLEYGIFFFPRDGTTMAFSTSTVRHCSHVADGYDIIGMSYSGKKNVQQLATNRTLKIFRYFKECEYNYPF